MLDDIQKPLVLIILESLLQPQKRVPENVQHHHAPGLGSLQVAKPGEDQLEWQT